MTALERQRHQTLTAVAREYARIRAGLLAAQEAQQIEATRIRCFLEQVDLDILEVLEQLRDLEGDEEIVYVNHGTGD
jgi:hypothetical protein